MAYRSLIRLLYTEEPQEYSNVPTNCWVSVNFRSAFDYFLIWLGYSGAATAEAIRGGDTEEQKQKVYPAKVIDHHIKGG
jgi:hypothetical protein